YKITLLNAIHYESVSINKIRDFPVLIKGGAKNEEGNDILTVWGVNTSSARIITLLQGNLTIKNIEFIQTVSLTEQGNQIWPWNAIIFAYDEVFSFRILSVDSCIFKGLGSQTPVRMMIYAYNVQKMNLTNCIFHDANISDSYAVCYQSQSNSEIIIDNSTFENINITNSGDGVLYIYISGQNSRMTINGSSFNNVTDGAYIYNFGDNSRMIINGSTFLNSSRGVYIYNFGYYTVITITGSTFENCVNNSYSSNSAALYIQSYSSSQNPNSYIIIQNKFINNFGYYTGGFYGYFLYGGTFNFSYNEFIHNRNNLSIFGNDAYLRWYQYPQDWTIDNAKYKVQKMFENCTPSNEKNVYYEFRVNDVFDISGYITSGVVEQDPGDDLEEGTEGCIWNVNQTGDGISTKKTIKGVLAGNCTDPEGYKITLLNAIHYESVSINKIRDFPVLIK
ncbi:MAG: hypothetical protein EZS28_044257, partial [Streblomastix strix]